MKQRTTLKTLRESRMLTQVAIAEASGITQADISRLEARDKLDDVYLGTLRRYAEALGGELAICVNVEGHGYEIRPEMSDAEAQAAMLREARKRAGLSLEALGKRMEPHWSVEALSRAESGRQEMHPHFVRRFLAACQSKRG